MSAMCVLFPLSLSISDPRLKLTQHLSPRSARARVCVPCVSSVNVNLHMKYDHGAVQNSCGRVPRRRADCDGIAEIPR